LIEHVVNVFETGKPEGKYDTLVVYADGKDCSRQVTFGRSQTTEQGNLKELVELYIQNGGSLADQLSTYVNAIGQTPLADNGDFKNLLVRAAREDPIMSACQDQFFDSKYYNRANQFFESNTFTFPLSMLVIYDSYIHSGSIPQFLRERFGELPPDKGGDEKKWISSYVEVRHEWLLNNTNPLLKKTIYRTQCFKDQIAANNWMLDILPIIANGVKVS